MAKNRSEILIPGNNPSAPGDSLDPRSSRTRHPLGRGTVPVLLLGLLAAFVIVSVATVASAEEPERAEPWEFRSQWGWYEGDRVHYYDMGRATNQTAPVYLLVDTGGDPVEGQGLIFADIRNGILVGVPGSTGYSDFHRVWEVQVPGGYVPDTHRSQADLVTAGLPMMETGLVMNTPMVPMGSRLVGADSGAHPLETGWWDGIAVHYFTFETSENTPGLFDPATGLILNTSSMAVFDPPGQLDLLYTYPGQAVHSPLSRLYIFNPISTEYVADEVRTWDEATALGFPIFPEGNMYNRPVVGGREAVARYQHDEPSVYELKNAWSGRTSRVLYYDMGPMLPGEANLYRFVTEEGTPIIAQHGIVEVVAPGILLGDVETEGYSTTWRLFDIIVEDETTFEPDLIKSMEDVRAMGFVINATSQYIMAPMITRDTVFRPVPSNPPGEGLRMVWYEGTGVYLNVLEPEFSVPSSAQDPPVNMLVRRVNATVILDPEGVPYADQQPILETLPTDEANYSVAWSIIEASGGDGYRQGRFRTREQLEERGWSFEASGTVILSGFVAGPINVPAWKPDRFTFQVGPVKDEDGKALKGVDVRISMDLEVVRGRTDSSGLVTFEVNSTWNDQTVQTFLSKTDYFNSEFAAEIEDYEHYIPLGGYVPPMVRKDDGGGLEGATAFALVGVLVIVLFVVAVLLKGRGSEQRAITEEEADEIFGRDHGNGDDDGDGYDEDEDGEEPLTMRDVEEIESGPERLS